MSYCTASLSAVKNEKKGDNEGGCGDEKYCSLYWGPSGQTHIDEMKSMWDGN